MRVGWPRSRVLPLVWILALPAWHATGQAMVSPLFAEPLHLTREVSDPISGTSSRLEEFCFGNRVISILGTRTSIADYEVGELTEIDRAKGTYSITSFDVVARALSDGPIASANERGTRRAPELTDAGVRSVGARGGRAFEATIVGADSTRKVEVVVDQQLRLSRGAVEVLVGAAFPLRRTEENEIAIAAAGLVRGGAEKGSGLARDHALPLEQAVTWSLDGDTLRLVNRIVRVGSELPALELTAIPPGARLVTSGIVLRQQLLEELDRLPSASPAANP
ncbi:MAG: hypothetical protein NDJ92_07010 [Thermoanaerobaculia bacterium]|nr:hypothetical protein [Thermoanaerobaculia bacterium]